MVPDVMCLAKSLGGGVPIGAIVARPGHDAVLQPGDHGSTFAGRPAGLRGGASPRARCWATPRSRTRCGARARRCCRAWRGWSTDGLATEARGRGLMCAIDLPRARAAEAVDALLARGYLANNTSARTVRFLPPLVIDQEDLDGLVAALRDCLPEVTA